MAVILSQCWLIASAVEKLDKGGVSIDFSKVKPLAAQTTGNNLLKNGSFEDVNPNGMPTGGWRAENWVWLVKGRQANAQRMAVKKKFSKLITCSTTTGNPAQGRRCVMISTPAVAHDLRVDKANGLPMFVNKLNYDVKIPENITPGTLNLSFMIRGRLDTVIPGTNNFTVIISPKGGDDEIRKCKTLGKGSLKRFPVTAGWSKMNMQFAIPADTRFISVSLCLYGCGEVFIDEIQLCKTIVPKGVTVHMMPLSFLDNTFCLTSGRSASICFMCRNEALAKIQKPFLKLKLPNEIKVYAVGDPLEIIERRTAVQDGKKYTEYVVDLHSYKKHIPVTGYRAWWKIAFLISTTAKPGIQYPGFYQFVDGKYRTPWQNFTLKIIHPPKAVTPPKRFKTAPMFTTEGKFSNRSAAGKIAADVRAAGFNSVYGGFPIYQAKEFKKVGIERYTQPHFLCNGYRIGKEKKPESALFKLADGTYRIRPTEAICPVEVYTQGKYYRDAVIPYIRDYLVTRDEADQIMCNWEPYKYDFKGCFCDRCKEEFINYSKIPRAEVKKAWPGKIIEKYRDIWIKFRSWQHGKLMETLERTVNAIGRSVGKDSHFIPETCFLSVTDDNEDFAQYNPIDYLESLPVIEPWGPYLFWNFTLPYIYYTGDHLYTFKAGNKVKQYIAKHVPDAEKRPALIAFPHGLQLDTWVTEPEAMQFEMLCYFLNGWQGAFLYFMPYGYDCRWWNAATEANRHIAAYEDFIFDGKRQDTVKVEPVTPLPAPQINRTSRGTKLISQSLRIVQVVEYELGAKRLIAIGNFWQKGECFFKLMVPGLQKNARYTVTQPVGKRCFIPAPERQYFTGKELADGILLQTGALRWNIYVIEPYNPKSNYGTPLDQAFMQHALEDSLPQIKKAIQWEKEYRKKSKSSSVLTNKLPDYSGLKAIANKGLTCKVVKNDNVPILKISGKIGEMSLSPAFGAMITSWIKNGSELVGKNPDGLCGDAFWWPRSSSGPVIDKPYKLVSQNKTANGLRFIFDRVLNTTDSKILHGVKLQKIYEFDQDDSFKITTTVINQTSKPILFSYRRRSIVALMGLDEKQGCATMGEKVYVRDFTQKLYRYATAQDIDIERAHIIDRILTAKSPNVVFSASGVKFKVEFSALDKNNLYGFVFWDSGNLKYSTFEQIFKKTTLAPSQSWKTTTRWRIIK